MVVPRTTNAHACKTETTNHNCSFTQSHNHTPHKDTHNEKETEKKPGILEPLRGAAVEDEDVVGKARGLLELFGGGGDGSDGSDGYNDDDGGVRVLVDDVSMLISKVVKLKDVFGRSRHTRRPPSDRLIGGFFLPTTVCRKACLKRVSA